MLWVHQRLTHIYTATWRESHMYSKCTLCNSGWKNPIRMSAHYRSSCHQRALERQEYAQQREIQCSHIAETCTHMRHVDPLWVEPEDLYEEMQCRFSCTLTTRNLWVNLWCVHERNMRRWWVFVSAHLPLPNELQFTIYRWLCAPQRKRKRGDYKHNGNLIAQTLVSREDYPLKVGIQSLARDLTYGEMRSKQNSYDSLDITDSYRKESMWIEMEQSSYMYDRGRRCAYTV